MLELITFRDEPRLSGMSVLPFWRGHKNREPLALPGDPLLELIEHLVEQAQPFRMLPAEPIDSAGQLVAVVADMLNPAGDFDYRLLDGIHVQNSLHIAITAPVSAALVSKLEAITAPRDGHTNGAGCRHEAMMTSTTAIAAASARI